MEPRSAKRAGPIRSHRHEQGIAMLVAVLILMLMGTIAIAAIQFSGEEWAAGGRSRASAQSFYAADAGLQVALNHLAQTPLDDDPIDLTLPNGLNVQSRTPADTAAQEIPQIGSTGAPEGYSLNIGAGFSGQVYLVNMTASRPDGTTSEIEMKVTAGLAPGS